MSKSTKRLASFNEVSKEINKLYELVANKQVSVGSNEGSEGSMRIVEGEDAKIYLEIKGKFGWYTSCVDVFQFKGYTRPRLAMTSVSSQLYFAKKIITSADVPSTVLLGTVPAGYVLRNISGEISTGFGSDNLISFSDGTTLEGNNIIDLRVPDTVFNIPLNKTYVSATDINAVLSGINSTGSMTVYLEAMKEI